MTAIGKNRAALTAVALLLTAVPGAAWAQAAPVKIEGNEAALRAAPRVTIAAFNVGFIFESVDAVAATGGLIGAFGGPTRIKSRLTGVTPDMMQQITDAAYADFKTQLAARGIDLVPPQALFADMSRLKPQNVPQSVNIQLEKKSTGKADYYKPGELPAMLMIMGDFTGSGMSSMGLNIAASQNGFQLGDYAKRNGIGVIDVTYLIDFSQQKRPGAFSFGNLQANAGVSVVPQYSRMTLLTAAGRESRVILRQHMAVEGELVEKSDATGGGSKAAQSAANVLGGVAAVAGLGGLRFGKSRTYDFVARPDAYKEGVAKAASLANAQMVAQIAPR